MTGHEPINCTVISGVKTPNRQMVSFLQNWASKWLTKRSTSVFLIWAGGVSCYDSTKHCLQKAGTLRILVPRKVEYMPCIAGSKKHVDGNISGQDPGL